MGYKYSKRSKANLATCHPDLQKILNELIKHKDCSIIKGHRNKAEQNFAFRTGKSQLIFPKSFHNKMPSFAVDVIPYPCNWSDLDSFRELADLVKVIASCYNIPIIWGGDWTTLVDMPHYELVQDKQKNGL